MNESVVYVLGPDDIPTCPKHGTRIVTDYFPETENAPEHEIGKCLLCNKTYKFIFDE